MRESKQEMVISVDPAVSSWSFSARVPFVVVDPAQGSLPESLFYAPSLAQGEGRAGSHRCTFWSCFGGHQGSALGVIQGKYPQSQVSCLWPCLCSFPLVLWHDTVEGCCKKCQVRSCLCKAKTETLLLCFCNKFLHKGQCFLQQLSPPCKCFRHIL